MSERVEVVLDDEGRLVLPPSLRKKLGLTVGATLVVESQTEGVAYLAVREKETRLVDKGGVLVVRGEVSEDVADVVRGERDRRTAEAVRRNDV